MNDRIAPEGNVTVKKFQVLRGRGHAQCTSAHAYAFARHPPILAWAACAPDRPAVALQLLPLVSFREGEEPRSSYARLPISRPESEGAWRAWTMYKVKGSHEDEIELLEFHPELKQERESEETTVASNDRFFPDQAPLQGSLKKELTLVDGIALVTGSIIGSGIFVSPNIVLKYSGSFGLSVSLWLLGAIISVVCGLSFIELGTFVKDCGGESAYILKAYSFKRKKPGFVFLGSLLSFLFTWSSTIVTRPASGAVITMVFARYLIRPFYAGCEIPEHIVKLIALSAIIIIAALNCYSVKLFGRVAVVFSSVKFLACVFIFVVGFGYIVSKGCLSPAFHHPFKGTTYSSSSVAIALLGVLWAYDGWNSVSYATEEIRDVEKNLPRSVIIGMFLVTVVYIPVNVAYFSVLSYEEMLAAEAVAIPFGKATLGTAGLVVIPILVAVSTFGTAAAGFYKGSRIVLSSAREGLLLDALSGVHRTFKTPIPAIVVLAVFSAVLVVTGNIDDLVEGSSSAVWLFYGIAIAGLLIMRVTHKDEPRPYKVWLVTPITGVLVCLYLVTLPVIQKPLPSLMAFGITLLGVPVYVFFVMEAPWRLRPKIFDGVAQSFSAFINALLNCQSSRSQH